MANEQRKDETLKQYRERLRREFRKNHPKLAALSVPGPWEPEDDLFLEAVTGEKLEPRREE
jgi:hypothetical protein